MYQGGTGLLPYSPSYQPRLYAPITPKYTSSQFTQPQIRLPYSPHTPRMDHFPNPPSPSSPYIPSSPTVYPQASTSALRPPTYMSPHLTQQFEGMSTTSPHIGTIPNLPDTDHTTLTVHEVSPREGTQGVQMTIDCDVDFPQSPQSSTVDESPGRPSGKALRVVFGAHPVQTSVHVLDHIGRSGPGQFCRLTATVPSWTNTGTGGRSNKVAIYIQVLAESHAIMETVPMGEFTYTAMSSRGE